MVRWLIEIRSLLMDKLQVECFANFADVYCVRGVDGHLIRQFHTDAFRKAFRKKAMKFARKFARKNGGLSVEKLDHTKEVVS